MKRFLTQFDNAFYRVNSVIVVVVLLTMVVLSFTQVILRNVAHGGILWADAVLRHLVMFVGMFGAVIAARQGRQIGIDIFSRVSNRTFKTVLNWTTGVFTIVICTLLTRAAWVFVLSEKEYASTISGSIPAWPFQMVIPIGFALIGLQVLLNLLLGRRNGLQESDIQPSEEARA